MKKPIILAGIAFLVSLAAGAAGRVVLAPPAPVANPELTEDAATETPLTGHASAPVPAVPEPDHHAEPPAPARAEAPPPSDPRPLELDAGGVEFREMGRILSALAPKDAGLFLGHLEDAQVLAILRAMNIAEAAPILDRMPEERAARLKAHLFDMPRGKR